MSAATLDVRASTAATYKFINIATESSTLRSTDWTFSVNSSGTVAFWAIGTRGPSIVKGNGGPLTTVAHSGGPFSTIIGPAVINDSGTVAFVGQRGNAGDVRGIYRITGNEPAVTIVEGTSGQPFSVVGRPSINESGTVAFVAAPAGKYYGVYTGDGGPLTRIAGGEVSDVAPTSTSINAGGVVAFRDGNSIFAGNGSTLDSLIGGLVGSPSINSSGAISFLNAGAVFVLRDGSLHPIADVNRGFAEFGGSSSSWPQAPINELGKVAFFATENSGDRGLYTGPDPLADAVIKLGEPLFGSSLTRLQGFPAINNRGDVAFQYRLDNGKVGIALARVVPEPTARALGVVAGLAMMLARYAGRTSRRTST